MPFAETWTEPECVMLSEINPSERQIPYDLTRTWNLRNSTDNMGEKKEK